MTQPAPSPPLITDEQLSGRAVEAVAGMHSELRRRYSGLNTAEAQLAEALLTAQAASEAGRMRLQEYVLLAAIIPFAAWAVGLFQYVRYH